MFGLTGFIVLWGALVIALILRVSATVAVAPGERDQAPASAPADDTPGGSDAPADSEPDGSDAPADNEPGESGAPAAGQIGRSRALWPVLGTVCLVLGIALGITSGHFPASVSRCCGCCGAPDFGAAGALGSIRWVLLAGAVLSAAVGARGWPFKVLAAYGVGLPLWAFCSQWPQHLDSPLTRTSITAAGFASGALMLLVLISQPLSERTLRRIRRLLVCQALCACTALYLFASLNVEPAQSPDSGMGQSCLCAGGFE